mmetsp:Transcript_43186/g.101531  ORF Transcript_43186/g.101531 Transcript_43186/m.101531 type:complete len:899 (+) Transcript_43186:97-2793(+)
MTAFALTQSESAQNFQQQDMLAEPLGSARSAQSQGSRPSEDPVEATISNGGLAKRSCLKSPISPRTPPTVSHAGSSSRADPYKFTYFRRLLESLAIEHERKVMQLEELQKANEALRMRRRDDGHHHSHGPPMSQTPSHVNVMALAPPPIPANIERPPTADLPGQLIEDIAGAFLEATAPSTTPRGHSKGETIGRSSKSNLSKGAAPDSPGANKSRRSGANQKNVIFETGTKLGQHSDHLQPLDGSATLGNGNGSVSVSVPGAMGATPTLESFDGSVSQSTASHNTSPQPRHILTEQSHMTHMSGDDDSDVNFKLRPQYRSRVDKKTIRQDGFAHADTKHFSEEEDGIVKKAEGVLAHVISQPGSPGRLWWDLLGAILIVYDIISVPLLVFEGASEGSFSTFMQWVTLLYWTFNVGASFQVGYVYKGVTIMNPVKIAFNYLKTWFVLDLIILLPEWSFTFLCLDVTCNDAKDSVKLFRGLRIARCLRLVRLLKMKWLFAKLDEMTDSEYSSILTHICKMIIFLLGLNHLIACAWFGLADMLKKTHNTWLVHHRVADEDWGTQYLTSFHWSITQFTPASMDVQPHNEFERGFAVTVIVFALVGFSYVVGSITGSLAQLRSLREAMSKQFWILKRYLRQNNVPVRLSIRIQNYVQHAWQLQAMGLSNANVQMLGLLSDQLRKELKSAIYVQHLLIHPLLSFLHERANVVIHRLAETAIMRKQLAARDSLFFKGEAAFCMYFIISGRLQYKRVYEAQEIQEDVDSGEDWISEPVLWSADWVHVGTCAAKTHCDLLQVVATDCIEVFRQNPNVRAVVTLYASNFMSWINQLTEDKINDICQGELETDHIKSFIPDVDEPTTPTPKGMVRARSGKFWKRSGTMQALLTSKKTSSSEYKIPDEKE